mmetsp:Transcript_70967/g.219363  ORF Transcript_70967/g.219363 Transcript_70967/m.219363 type:complete len:226 (+) Transcript_70967:82-759(+)
MADLVPSHVVFHASGRPCVRPLADRLRGQGLEVVWPLQNSEVSPDLVCSTVAGPLGFCLLTPQDLLAGSSLERTLARLSTEAMQQPRTSYILAVLSTTDVLSAQQALLERLHSGGLPVVVPCSSLDYAADFISATVQSLASSEERHALWADYRRTYASSGAFFKEALASIPGASPDNAEEALRSAGSLRALATSARPGASKSSAAPGAMEAFFSERFSNSLARTM